MSDYVIWFSAAFGLIAAELFTGTFYLLMLAIGCTAGGVAAVAGADQTVQLVVGAAVGILATAILRRTRWGRLQRAGDASQNPNVILDIGQKVEIPEWQNGHARIEYRGALWDAELEHGAEPTAGTMVIRAIRGSTLVLSPAPRSHHSRTNPPAATPDQNLGA